jgi:hypothetical protein
VVESKNVLLVCGISEKKRLRLAGGKALTTTKWSKT